MHQVREGFISGRTAGMLDWVDGKQQMDRREDRIFHLPLHQWMHRYRMSQTLHFESEAVVEVMRSAFQFVLSRHRLLLLCGREYQLSVHLQ